MPAIRGALWEGRENNTRAIVLTNTSNSTQTASIPVPLSWRKNNAEICGLSGSCASQLLSASTATISVTLAGRDVQIIKLTN